MKPTRLAILLLMIPLFFSCKEPDHGFCFTDIDHKTGFDAPVTFEIKMIDTINPQQLDVTARLYHHKQTHDTIPVVLQVKSPGGQYGCDTLYLPITAENTDNCSYIRTNGHTTFQWTYRRNIINREYGVWSFTLSPLEEYGDMSVYKSITGLGIYCKTDR